MMSKKGVGHVEVIISFVIFLGFLGFLLWIFNPFDFIDNSSLVDSIIFNMEEELLVEVNSVSISLAEGVVAEIEGIPKNCFKISGFDNIIEDLDCKNDMNMNVKDKGENIVKAKSTLPSTSPNFFIELTSSFTGENRRFYTISCSSEINNQLDDPESCHDVNDRYALGIIKNKKVWSLGKLNELAGLLSDDATYPSEKVKYVGVGEDFAFQIKDLTDGVNDIPLTKQPSRGTQADARTIPIDVIDSEGTIKKMTLTVSTW